MTLRKATTFFICLGTLALVCVISLATHLIINASFSDLEREHARQNIERARNAMLHELASLDDTLVDWAVWDDAKKFMQGHAPDFVESNLNDRTLASLRLTAIVFMDRSGRIVWSQGFDPVQGIKDPLPEGLTSHLQAGSPLLYATNVEDRVKGFLRLPQALMLVASCPVTGSDGLGPPVGTLVMLRALDAQESAAIAERVRLPLSIERADTPPSADIAPLTRDMTGGMRTGPVSADLYCAVLFLPDILGEPALRLVLRDTREIMSRGDSAMNMALGWMLLGTLVCSALLLAYLERNVLRRLAHLKDQVETIGTEAAAPANAEEASGGCLAKIALGRVEMPGNDELSALALRINSTLAELERSRENPPTSAP
jgi:sensor domain CHASE-containing protein